jgi:hypothetical protein
MYRGLVVRMCFVIDPECAKAKATSAQWNCSEYNGCAVRDVIPVGAPNTYLDPDADEVAKDKGEQKHPWWKFWRKNEPEK